MAHEYHTIGKPHWRVDGLGKVTGSARFAADLGAPGMLHARVLIAARPHARILSIDTAAARALPGVRAVMTVEDLPAARCFGTVIKNLPVLAGDRVRYYGDGVAMVAAETAEIAEEALAAIRVAYEDLPILSDPEAALEPNAPQLHEDQASASPAGEVAGNICAQHSVGKGDPAEGFARAEVVLERTYRTSAVDHAYLEPEALLAEPAADGGVRVIGSIQNIFSTRRALGEVLDLDLARVTVEHATLGGSFGGKDDVMTQMACRAALLARACGRPVKMVNTRERSMTESYKRHPYILHYKIGATRDGRLTALEARIIADAGAYGSMSPFVTWRSAVQVTGPYECPHVRAQVTAVYTNNVYTGAMRGFGSPQVNFAIECLIDELAEQLQIDPLELRLRNGFREGSHTVTGQALPAGVSLPEVLERAGAGSDWLARRAQIEAHNGRRTDGRRRGLGLACAYRGVSLGAEGIDAAGALVSVQTDGSVAVSIGLTDMGQGVASALSLIAAEVLGVPISRIKFFDVHTGRVPDSGPTVSSRATIMGGQAVKRAAESVRAVLVRVAAEMLGAPQDELQLRQNRIGRLAGGQLDPAQSIPFREVAARVFDQGLPLLGFGWYRAPHTSWDPQRGRGDTYFTFVYGANVAEVEVDTATGKVDLLRVWAIHDVGRAISPAMLRNQVYGGVVMGLGYGLLEQYAQREGIPLTRNFDEYLIPTAMDLPEIDVTIVENPDPAGPFGAKSIGEPATEIAAPAIVNAIAHATGRRVTSLPADLETVRLGHPLSPPLQRTREASAPKPTEGKRCAG